MVLGLFRKLDRKPVPCLRRRGLYRPLGAPGGRYSLLLPAYVCDERRWLIARPITSFRSASSVMPSKPKPK
jgi:hypothetical protein